MVLFIERYHKKRDDDIESLKHSAAYLQAIYNEVKYIEEKVKGASKLKESNTEIYDFVFPTETYDKLAIDKVETSSTETKSIIMDFYTRIKIRNRIYLHRKEVKHRFIRTKNEEGWKTFIEYTDPLIANEERYLSVPMIEGFVKILYEEKEDKINETNFETKSFLQRYWTRIKQI